MDAVDVATLQKRKLARWGLTTIVMVIGLALSILFTLNIGAVDISFNTIFEVLLGGGDEFQRDIIINTRLPRIVLGTMVGAALAVAGAAMQGVFRNPMASPYVLGISAGAAFGASLAIVLGISWLPGRLAIPSMSFLFCFLTLFLVYGISRTKGGFVPVETLLLAGIAVGAFFNALVSLMKYFAGDELSAIVFWMLGGLWRSSWEDVAISLPMIILGTAVIWLLSRDLNTMMVGEEHALHLGLNVNAVRLAILLAASLVTAAAVSVSGIIGFVGLVIPHVVRLLVGPDHRILIPVSLLGGAIFMIWTDTIARTILLPAELPVGIITAIIGAPFFIYLIISRRRKLEW
ncbi:MAG: iron chelate uptake ABC transporter family permease subunit [Euryarchaeota archaeon]|nr:iron chelate uptake ABC transporter family permease subunit [Euryarchaeota archaeon]